MHYVEAPILIFFEPLKALKKSKYCATIFFVTIALSSLGWSKPSNETELYYRCYSKLTGRPPEFKLKKLNSIYQRKNSAIAACKELLDSVVLEEKEAQKKIVVTSENVLILNQLHDLHTSWLTFSSPQPTSNSSSDLVTRDIYDSSEPALYITRALFGRNIDAKTIVTTSNQLSAIRENGPSQRGLFSGGQFPNEYAFGDSVCKEKSVCNSILAESGRLVGIRERSELVTNYVIKSKVSQLPDVNAKTSLFKHLGGGLMGSQSYLFNSLVMNYGFRGDGGISTPRIWATAVYHDTLCRSQPLLRGQDVIQYIDKKSSLSYRQQPTCLRCHSAIDQMGGVLRGIHFAKSPFDEIDTSKYDVGHAPYSLDLYPNDKESSEVWKSEPSSDYWRESPNGRLLFRNYRGELVNLSTTNLQDLGKKIADQDDFYLCLTSRYFQYFTGIKLEIADPYNDVLDEKTKHLLRLLGDMSLRLKKHQSLKALIKEILDSEQFLKDDRAETNLE